MRGSCLCGGVTFEIDGPIVSPRYCHCGNCRKFSGTAYAAWGLIRADQFAITRTQSAVTKYDSGGGLRAFCAACGSPLWYEPAGLTEFVGIPLGVIDGSDVPAPRMHVWTKSKLPWALLDDDLPQHATHP